MSETPEKQPALMKDEWDEVRGRTGLVGVALYHREPEVRSMTTLPPPERHAAAAVALHEQPFGFTWEDVDNLRATARRGRRREIESRTSVTQTSTSLVWGELDDLADRIEALLPPKEE